MKKSNRAQRDFTKGLDPIQDFLVTRRPRPSSFDVSNLSLESVIGHLCSDLEKFLQSDIGEGVELVTPTSNRASISLNAKVVDEFDASYTDSMIINLDENQGVATISGVRGLYGDESIEEKYTYNGIDNANDVSKVIMDIIADPAFFDENLIGKKLSIYLQSTAHPTCDLE